MPRVVDIALQRRMITNAAIAVINEAGLEGARLRDVALAAKVTTGAVTHYFDGKDAVLEAALEEIVRRTLERMDASRQSGAPGDVAAFLKRLSAFLPVDEPSRQEWRVWLAFWGRAISDEGLRAVHRTHYQAIVSRLIPSLQGLQSPAHPHTQKELRGYADAVIGAIDGVGTRATLESELWTPKRQRDTLGQLLQPMLAVFASRSHA